MKIIKKTQNELEQIEKSCCSRIKKDKNGKTIEIQKYIPATIVGQDGVTTTELNLTRYTEGGKNAV